MNTRDVLATLKKAGKLKTPGAAAYIEKTSQRRICP
jgi:hypothetical protein